MSHPHAVTLRDLGINEFSSSKITTLLLCHFSEISKPCESVPATCDDHGLSDDNVFEPDLDLPLVHKKAVLIRCDIDRIQAQQDVLPTNADNDKAATFRLSPKTLDTLYVH
jgi:hypothetical protein